MIDQNRQLTNDIYLRSVEVDAEIDSTDELALLAIALLTPCIGGDGVYAARAMLGIDADDYGLAYRMGNEMQNEVTRTEDIRAYPNPAQDQLWFESPIELETQGLLTLYTVTGKRISGQWIDAEQSLFSINLSGLTPGTYFYSYVSPTFASNGRFIKK